MNTIHRTSDGTRDVTIPYCSQCGSHHTYPCDSSVPAILYEEHTITLEQYRRASR